MRIVTITAFNMTRIDDSRLRRIVQALPKSQWVDREFHELPGHIMAGDVTIVAADTVIFLDAEIEQPVL